VATSESRRRSQRPGRRPRNQTYPGATSIPPTHSPTVDLLIATAISNQALTLQVSTIHCSRLSLTWRVSVGRGRASARYVRDGVIFRTAQLNFVGQPRRLIG
jgi:hypothetical protein